MEPLFYAMTIQAVQPGGIPRELILRGWHGAVMTSNVGFVDGSARATRVMDLADWEAETLRKMRYYGGVGQARRFLRSGDTWQMHCYPTPAAFIPKFTSNGTPAVTYAQAVGGRNGWPYGAMQNNMRSPN